MLQDTLDILVCILIVAPFPGGHSYSEIHAKSIPQRTSGEQGRRLRKRCLCRYIAMKKCLTDDLVKHFEVTRAEGPTGVVKTGGWRGKVRPENAPLGIDLGVKEGAL